MLTRRKMLKSCAAAGGAFLFSTKAPIPRSFADDIPQSPLTTPFLDPLPLPPPPTSTSTPFANLDPAANFFFDPTGVNGKAKFYTIIVEDRSVQFHHDLPPTPIWGYRDGGVASTPFASGPTFITHITGNQFAGNIVRFQNNLRQNETGFGIPQLSTHLHGGHHPARSDGFASDARNVAFRPVINPGDHYDYTLPLLDPGFFSDVADPTERPSTLWYHDHILDFTGANVYRGLAGFFLVFEDPDALGPSARDINNENDPRGLRLPSGEFDIPIVIQDKTFASDGSLVFDQFNHDGFLGDKFVLNGKIQPFLEVQRRRYRFRFLNGSNARFFGLFLTNAAGKTFPMTMIATEGGLLSRPLPNTKSLLISPALRFEVVVDFTMFNENDKVYIENRLVQDDGRGPGGTFEQPQFQAPGTRLLELRIGTTPKDPSLDVTQPGVVLRPFNKISAQELAGAMVRDFEFNRNDGAFTINGQLADLNKPMVSPTLNGPEIWRLRNSSGGWWHPIHIHDEFHRVLSRNGTTPTPFLYEQDGIAKKDTVILGPNSEVEVFFRFRDYAGPWMFHCHNLEHEDMAMMARFDVIPQPGQRFV